ncbi:hypothetical protein PV10_01803 [Exophiala mesophila]|uniref:Ecp2 effector protein domain-containing protein n=1 Tax=Exophiala mesophila TaxID=212818 RepID=A0A0D2AGR6_EXOME|nr:uncharacterized protein PV10_01803 [Exophiala mesophila]KIV98123.1 hypothetical protein PV10_01803 [Exophiala mesophila]
MKVNTILFFNAIILGSVTLAFTGQSTPTLTPLDGSFNGIRFNESDTDSADLVTRSSSYGVYICSKPHWQGTCFWSAIDESRLGKGDCGAVTAFDGWASVGPDQGLKVDIYRDIYCATIGKAGVLYPGVDDLISNGVPEAISAYFGMKFFKA